MFSLASRHTSSVSCSRAYSASDDCQMKKYLKKISAGKILTQSEAKKAMQLICTARVDTALSAALLSMIHFRGETTDELVGFVNYVRQQSIPIPMNDDCVIDMSGTGGDYSNSFNISTASSLLLASQGIKVAKHGGRSVSSQCGTADVLEALGIPIQKKPESICSSLDRLGFVFLFAPYFNHAFADMTAFRKMLGIRTCFNVLGPLLHPLRVKRQVMGVYRRELLLPVAETLYQLGSEEVMVIHARDGLDEFSIQSTTDVAHLKSGSITCYSISPEDFNIPRASIKNLRGHDAKTNAHLIENIFSGQQGPQRHVVILNAAAGFVVSGKASSLHEGIQLAEQGIDSGKAKDFMMHLKNND